MICTVLCSCLQAAESKRGRTLASVPLHHLVPHLTLQDINSATPGAGHVASIKAGVLDLNLLAAK